MYRATPRAPRRSDGRAPSEDFQPESPQRTTSTSKTPVDDREAKRKGRNRQHLHSSSLQGPEVVSAKTAQPNPRSILLDADLHQDDRDLRMDISPSVVLSLQKQIRTSLIVRVAPSLEYAPLKLSGCTNPEAFYNKVLGAWEVHRESVAKMTVTFNWMAQEDPMRRMVMNDQMERFAHLLEQVEEAPCWAEAPEGKGKCVLNVEIVLKEVRSERA